MMVWLTLSTDFPKDFPEAFYLPVPPHWQKLNSMQTGEAGIC
jgi:hypothetical protein